MTPHEQPDAPIYADLLAEHGDVPADVAAIEVPPPPVIAAPAEEAADRALLLANPPRDEHGRFLPLDEHEDEHEREHEPA